MGEFIKLEKKDHISIVTMEHAPVNAANRQFYQEMTETFDAIGADGNCRVAILRSAYEKYWCAGNDVKDFEGMTPDNGHIRHRVVYNSFIAVYDCAVPVIAAIDGYCLGTGLAYASVCDIIFATGRAVIGAPEITVGVMGAGKFLSRMVPQFVMRRMIYNGDKVSAAELEKWGCLRVVLPAKLMDVAMEQANLISGKCPSTMRLNKEALNRIEFVDLKTGYAVEQSYTRRASAYEDSKEAQRAFFEKRAPVFRGR
ncbi:MAG: enoyl-CoA hydratase/isomerase family protein [Synergistaceae bacterium]|jgi:enoyl-CoA hydratase|nr:enoyl-CoA hydratase/isomerase family protein [Synergistaceae bacterium]